jgi:hypothetical protein
MKKMTERHLDKHSEIRIAIMPYRSDYNFAIAIKDLDDGFKPMRVDQMILDTEKRHDVIIKDGTILLTEGE